MHSKHYYMASLTTVEFSSCRCTGNGDSTQASVAFCAAQAEGRCTWRSPSQNYSRLLLRSQPTTSKETNVTLLLAPTLCFCGCFLFKVELYEDFSKSQAKKEVDSILSVEEDQPQSNTTSQQTHVFQVQQNRWHNCWLLRNIFLQALQYLRKVCNHPLLVLNSKHPLYARITDNIDPNSLKDTEHAAKMVALK